MKEKTPQELIKNFVDRWILPEWPEPENSLKKRFIAQQAALIEALLPSEEKQMVYFNNHSNCYADMGDDIVIPAMTRGEVLKALEWYRSYLLDALKLSKPSKI